MALLQGSKVNESPRSLTDTNGFQFHLNKPVSLKRKRRERGFSINGIHNSTGTETFVKPSMAIQRKALPIYEG
jgi:hypothetical protein